MGYDRSATVESMDLTQTEMHTEGRGEGRQRG